MVNMNTFIIQSNQCDYTFDMQTAGTDAAFLKRTLDTQEAFTHTEIENEIFEKT